MSNLSKEEENVILEKLEKLYYPNKVEYLGSCRFKVQETYYPIDGEPTPVPRDKILLNERGESILTENPYDWFSPVLNGGVIKVSVHKNLRFENDRYVNDNRVGLIDKDGLELIPCIYDSIEVKGDATIYISKDGQQKSTSLVRVKDGNFDWAKAIARRK